MSQNVQNRSGVLAMSAVQYSGLVFFRGGGGLVDFNSDIVHLGLRVERKRSYQQIPSSYIYQQLTLLCILQ